MILPCSVPTMNLPPAPVYSIAVAPMNAAAPCASDDLSTSHKPSIGSPSFLTSHQSTWPSVDVETHSKGVLPANHAILLTGSRWEFSMIETSFGVEPTLVS